jgi:hypothetical protein
MSIKLRTVSIMNCLHERCGREAQGQCHQCGGFFCRDHITREDGKLFCVADSPTALAMKRRSLESRYNEALVRIRAQALRCLVCGRQIFPEDTLFQLAKELFLESFELETRLRAYGEVMISARLEHYCTCPDGHHVCSDHEFKPVSETKRRVSHNTSTEHIITGHFECPLCRKGWSREIRSYRSDWC